jgi:hypothetical protein
MGVRLVLLLFLSFCEVSFCDEYYDVIGRETNSGSF